MSTVLFICQGYAPYYGGAENALTAIAEDAAKDPTLDVHVITSDIGGRLSAFEQLNGVNIHRVSAPKKEWTRHTVKELLGFYFSVTKQINSLQTKIKPDFIFAHFTMPAGLVARKWFLKYKTPYVVVLHGSDVPGYQPDRFKLIHVPMQVVSRMVWKHAKNVVAVGQPLKELAQKTWNGKISVIPNGVDLNIFTPADQKQFPDSTSLIKFAYPAQLIPRKGIQYLIQAISLLSEAHKDRVKINIYGTGPYKAELEKMIEGLGLNEQLQLCGLIEKDDMCQTLQSNDMFIMSSLQEGLPLSLLEAMACGLPPIVTRVGDIESVITNNQDGILIQPASQEDIKDALEKVLNTPSLIPEMRDKTIERSHAFSWDKIWQQYKEMM